MPGCDAAGCGAVLTSKWSKIFGVPVGLFGTGLYATLAWFAVRGSAPRRGMLTILAATLALLIPAAAAWFAALQLFVLKAFCPWCSGTHLIATTGAVLFLVAWSREQPRPRGPPRNVPPRLDRQKPPRPRPLGTRGGAERARVRGFRRGASRLTRTAPREDHHGVNGPGNSRPERASRPPPTPPRPRSRPPPAPSPTRSGRRRPQLRRRRILPRSPRRRPRQGRANCSCTRDVST